MRIAEKNRKVVGNILLILILFVVLSAEVYPFNGYHFNEFDRLPMAKQAVDRDWLPNDWYLNLEHDTYFLFNLLLGPLVSIAGFRNGAVIGRLSSYLLISISFFYLFKTLKFRKEICVIVVFLFLSNESLVAGEWIAGGIESKVFSYGFAILALSFFLQRKYGIFFAFSGAAFSLHILTGFYAVFCTAIAILFTGKQFLREWKLMIRKIWIFLITGIFGLEPILDEVIFGNNINSDVTAQIYVNRVSHHLLPSSWDGTFWIYFLIICAIFFLSIYIFYNSTKARFLAAYALGSVVLFLVGIGFYQLGYVQLLKYYWFRFPDVIIPLLNSVLFGYILNDLANGVLRFKSPKSIDIFLAKVKNGFSYTLLFLSILIFVFSTREILRGLSKYDQTAFNGRPIFSWIEKNTSTDAVFLVDPTMLDFYIFAQRAVFVSYKHIPNKSADVYEWSERLQLFKLGHNSNIRVDDTKAVLRSNFYALDENSIMEIAESYNIDYYLGLPGQDLPFEKIHALDGFVLYEIIKQ